MGEYLFQNDKVRVTLVDTHIQVNYLGVIIPTDIDYSKLTKVTFVNHKDYDYVIFLMEDNDNVAIKVNATTKAYEKIKLDESIKSITLSSLKKTKILVVANIFLLVLNVIITFYCLKHFNILCNL